MNLLQKIYLIQSQLNSAISEYYLNERINYWYEQNPNDYSTILQDLGTITESLRNECLITIAKVFDSRDKKSISFQKIVNLINDTKCVENEEKHRTLKNIANDAQSIIDNHNIKELISWRDHYLAHLDKSLKKYMQMNFDVPYLISICSNIFSILNKILKIFGEDEILLTADIYKNSIDKLFIKYNK